MKLFENDLRNKDFWKINFPKKSFSKNAKKITKIFCVKCIKILVCTTNEQTLNLALKNLEEIFVLNQYQEI